MRTPVLGGWGLFLSGCFLAATGELMQRLAKSRTQKHQNRPQKALFLPVPPVMIYEVNQGGMNFLPIFNLKQISQTQINARAL